ncbi:MAG: S1-like domain-containing RNA-binding protein [Salibacteraceae bacterium]|nr:S1-like domain-containing RNA-binding protein [Salibacteraceae bacterium]
MKIGETNSLKIARETKIGLYLEDSIGLEVLLPKRFVPEDVKPGDMINVFVYRDNEDRPIATTQTPKAELRQFAALEVKSVSAIGAFLDWGIMKDLFVPFNQQIHPMKEGDIYVVYVYLDELTQRLAATTRIEQFLNPADLSFEKGQPLNAVVFDRTEIGYKVMLDKTYSGMIYANQVFQKLSIGQELTVYVNNIREDGKIDVLVQKPGVASIEDSTSLLRTALQENNGYLPLTDSSSPQEISTLLHISKKQFKKAVGNLYKQREIKLTEDGIELVKK